MCRCHPVLLTQPLARRPHARLHSRLPRPPSSCVPSSNLVALGFLVKFQKHLSLRVLVLQPLVITFIMLLSTAALVRAWERRGGRSGGQGGGAGWWGAGDR